MTEPAGVEDANPASAPARWRGPLILLLKLTAVGVAIWVATRIVRSVDWSAVADALRQLAWWQVLVLLAVVGMRQVATATPLALFTPRLPIGRAVANDLVGNLVATFAPAPSDIVIRMALFRQWGVDVARGLAGLVLNSIFFYVARLAAPVIGFLLLWSIVGYDGVLAATAITSGLGALAIAVALGIGMQSNDSAGALGRFLGRRLSAIRSSWPGPEKLEARLREFHRNISDRLRRKWSQAGLASFVQVLIEATILVLALRFVGVDAGAVPTLVIVGCFLVAYPMTALPLIGLGVLDATLIALIAERSAAESAELVAGVVVWRVCVQLVPLVAGAITGLYWRSRGLVHGDAERADVPDAPADAAVARATDKVDVDGRDPSPPG